MNSDNQNEHGQITLLVLMLSLIFLSAMSVIGVIAEGIVQQIRLNNIADAAALAGAQELEFNSENACIAAEPLLMHQENIELMCETSNEKVFVRLTQPSKARVMRNFRPVVVASASAGLTTPSEMK